MTRVELTPGQWGALMQFTSPSQYQTERTRTLRAALEGAQPVRSHARYVLEMTDEMIESASYVLKVAATTRGGALRRASDRFEAEYALQGLTPRERLLKAREAGAAIREVGSFKEVAYDPDGYPDTPWVVYEPDLEKSFRLPDADVHPVWTA